MEPLNELSYIRELTETLLIYACLLVTIGVVQHLSVRRRRYAVLIGTSAILIAIVTLVCLRFAPGATESEQLMTVRLVGGALHPVMAYFAYLMIVPRSGRLFIWVPLLTLNGVFYLTGPFHNLILRLDVTGVYHRYWPGYVSFVLCGVLIGLILFEGIRYDRQKKTKDSWILVLAAVAVLSSIALQNYLSGMDILDNGITLALIFYAVYFNIREGRAEMKTLLERQHTELMVSQIQPHFIYNCLSGIYALVDADPDKAKSAIDHFADYLRQKLHANTESVVPLETELETVRTYVWLEQMRFGDRLKVEYDIAFADFRVPFLSIQPVVENAIKHGLTEKKDGGTVLVKTWETENAYFAEVRDDGVGFAEGAPAGEGGIGIGLKNVKSRLRALCGGTLDVDSEPGKGTTVRIQIPKDRGPETASRKKRARPERPAAGTIDPEEPTKEETGHADTVR